jgi:hypothetical protein
MCGALTLVVAMIVNVLSKHLGPAIHVTLGSIPLTALIVFTIGQFGVLTLCFKGVLLLQKRTRLFVLLAFALGILVSSATLRLNLVDAILALPPVALALFANQRERFTTSNAWWPALAGAAGMTIAFTVAARTGNDVLLFRLASFAALFAAIGLFMASTDLAEIAQIGSDAIADQLIFKPGTRGTMIIIGGVVASAVACFVIGAAAMHIPASWTPLPGTFLGTGFTAGQFLDAAESMLIDLSLLYWISISVGRGRNLWIKPHFPYLVVFAVVALCTLLYYVADVQWFVNELSTSNIATSNELMIAQGALLTISIAGLLIAGPRSPVAFLAFGFGSVIAVLWLFEWSRDTFGSVTLPFNVSLGTLGFLIIALLWPKTRDRFPVIGRMLISLNLAIAAYSIVSSVFLSVPMRLHDGTIVQASIVIAALAWDVLTSGSITRPHSDRFPHNARTSFFIAYVSLVALFVMMSSAMTLANPKVPGTNLEDVFDSELFVYLGLLLFGGPMLIFLFFIRMRAVLQYVG